MAPPFLCDSPQQATISQGWLTCWYKYRAALLNRCFMLTLDVINSSVSAGHWEKPGIYCSNYNFLATSPLSPPPMCCREIKFQQTSACFQWVSTFRDPYKHTIMLSNWAIILHYVLIEKKKSPNLMTNQRDCYWAKHSVSSRNTAPHTANNSH